MKNNYQTTSSIRSKKQISNRALLLVILIMSAFSLKAQVPSYVPTNGLVGWWPFNGNANDESGSGNNGTPLNGVTLTSDRLGNPASAYSFDGVDDYIEVANNMQVTLIGNLTMSAWVKTNGSNGQNYQTIISKRETYWTWEYNMILSYHTGIIHENKLITSRALGIGNQEQAWSTTTYLPSTWEFWTVAYTSGQVSLYKNGILDQTQSFTLIPNQQLCPLLFGKNTLVDNSEQFFGAIDDIGIWNRALTQQEITALYNGCQLSINTQPTNQNITVNNNAQFIVNSSDPNATYQWQTDLGVGFQNLSSVGQYSGANNDTLTVSYVTFANNNQPFRCIINSGSCSDTSNVAVLTVNNNVGINEISANQLFSVYPNPTSTVINLKSDAQLLGVSYFIYDNLGKRILSGKVTSENMPIDLNQLAEGNYLIGIDDNSKKQSFKVIKN